MPGLRWAQTPASSPREWVWMSRGGERLLIAARLDPISDTFDQRDKANHDRGERGDKDQRNGKVMQRGHSHAA